MIWKSIFLVCDIKKIIHFLDVAFFLQKFNFDEV